MYVGFFDIKKKQLFFVDNVALPIVGIPIKNKEFSFLPKNYLVEYVETVLFEEMDLDNPFDGVQERAFVAVFLEK